MPTSSASPTPSTSPTLPIKAKKAMRATNQHQ
jgi:hypothetical protein